MFILILSTPPPYTASHPPPKENAKKDPPINSPNVCSKPSWCGPWTQYLLCCTEAAPTYLQELQTKFREIFTILGGCYPSLLKAQSCTYTLRSTLRHG